jgi:hypothetical protein
MVAILAAIIKNPSREADDMPNDTTVTVFNFLSFDLDSGSVRMSPYKATRASINALVGGEVLEGTGHDVPVAELDELGRYVRVATGWGVLK